MAEVSLDSKPATATQFTKPERYILYTRTLGQVKGDRFVPQDTLDRSTIKILSKISELEYQGLELNPTYSSSVSRLDDGTYVKEVGQVFEGQLFLNELAPEKFQQNKEGIREIAIASSQETIANSPYVDASNQNPNVANTLESVGDLKSQATPPSQSRVTIQNRNIKRNKISILTYPQDMHDNQDRIKFTVWKYKESFRDINNPQTSLNTIPTASDDSFFDKVDGDVYLPISNKIQDTNSAVWNTGEINEFQRRLADISLKLMPPGGSGTQQALDSMGELFKYATENNAFGNMVRSYLAGQAVGVGNLLTRSTGAVFNSNMELLFQGPAVRDFSFGFGLVGKRAEESATIKQIIRFFKKNMAVRDDVDKFFLNSPYVFGIEYQKGTDLHPSIGKIKKCALINCSVDYTPMGSYMTYDDDDASMFMYSLSLQFRELTPIYSSNYDDHAIGY